jgi:hypothetical protein
MSGLEDEKKRWEKEYSKNDRQQNGKTREKQVTQRKIKRKTKKEAVWRHLNKRFRIEERTGKLPTNTQEKEEYVTDQ